MNIESFIKKFKKPISSAFTNSRQSRICGRSVNEAVVLPAPFGPAMMNNLGMK